MKENEVVDMLIDMEEIEKQLDGMNCGRYANIAIDESYEGETDHINCRCCPHSGVIIYGEGLDCFARLFGLERNQDESDDSLMVRIVARPTQISAYTPWV